MLITVEGIDGSGKSTVCQALDSAFPDAVMTCEPTNSWYGDAVRRSINADDADPLAELFLYTADHAAHLATVIRPALAQNRLIISDRYSDSRYAYQGTTLAEHLADPIAFIQEIHQPWTISPDLTLYLDVPASVGAERSAAANKFERESTLAAVRTNYEALVAAEPERFRRIDATQDSDQVVESALQAVKAAR